MTQELFDRDDLKSDADQIKHMAYEAIMSLCGTETKVEPFSDIVLEAFNLYGFIIRAQILEGVSRYLREGNLTEANIDKTIRFLVNRVDGCASHLGDMVNLVNETKTPGARH